MGSIQRFPKVYRIYGIKRSPFSWHRKGNSVCDDDDQWMNCDPPPKNAFPAKGEFKFEYVCVCDIWRFK